MTAVVLAVLSGVFHLAVLIALIVIAVSAMLISGALEKTRREHTRIANVIERVAARSEQKR